LTLADGINDNAVYSEKLGIEKKKTNPAMDDTKITINQAYKKAARWQLIVTLTFCIVYLLFSSVNAAISCLMGGLVALTGGYAGVLMTRRRVAQSAGSVLIVLLKAEATKIMVICLQLLVIFKLYNGLVPMALIGGLAASVLVAGAGLGVVGTNKK
jgi:ATP synthase protein I